MMVKMDKNFKKYMGQKANKFFVFLKWANCVQKNGLILGPIPKISPKKQFFLKIGYWTGYKLESVGNRNSIRGSSFPRPRTMNQGNQNHELGYLGFDPQFWSKTKKLDRVDTPSLNYSC
jgi:hypothetical protein